MTRTPMPYDGYAHLLDRVREHGLRWLEGLPDRPVHPPADLDVLAEALGGPLPETGADPVQVLDTLVAAAEPALVASAGPRFFGYVIGGSLPAATAADLMAVLWDQNAGLVDSSPPAAVTERVASAWLLDLLRLPVDATVGFATGGGTANYVCLAAARDAVLARAGWDVAADGLQGAPTVRVMVGADRHSTVDTALRYLGLGERRAVPVDTDDQGRMLVPALTSALSSAQDGPAVVVAAAGNVNSGAFDPLADVVSTAHQAAAWVHVDGAFGLWAAANPATRHLVDGAGGADSWAVDAHKWLNTPYDCGLAVVADRAAHLRAMTAAGSYLIKDVATPDPLDLVPEFSRRARGLAVWAALRSLGRAGVADLVERCCAHARLFAELLDAVDGLTVLNQVVLDQVMIRLADDDVLTRALQQAVVAEGTAFVSPTVWRGSAAIRISVVGWSTSREDVERTAAVIARLAGELQQGG